jgi:hypothetical protein
LATSKHAQPRTKVSPPIYPATWNQLGYVQVLRRMRTLVDLHPEQNPRNVCGRLRAQRKGLTLQRIDLGIQRGCADPPAHVAMTMQSPLSPAADMPPHWLWAAMCRYCCKSRRGAAVEFKFETIESRRAYFRIVVARSCENLNQCYPFGRSKYFCNNIGTLLPRANAAACPQLAKADFASSSHRLAWTRWVITSAAEGSTTHFCLNSGLSQPR